MSPCYLKGFLGPGLVWVQVLVGSGLEPCSRVIVGLITTFPIVLWGLQAAGESCD